MGVACTLMFLGAAFVKHSPPQLVVLLDVGQLSGGLEQHGAAQTAASARAEPPAISLLGMQPAWRAYALGAGISPRLTAPLPPVCRAGKGKGGKLKGEETAVIDQVRREGGVTGVLSGAATRVVCTWPADMRAALNRPHQDQSSCRP